MSSSLKRAARIEIELHDLAVGGEGVGRVNNFVVFVPYGVPGDTVEVEITEVKKNYARGRILRIIESSRRRIRPRCPIYTECGGCQLQHIDYDAQLYYKTKIVKDALSRLADLSEVKVKPCRRMDTPWHYRNKAQVVVSAKQYLKKRGQVAGVHPVVGFYAKGTHNVVPVNECLIQSEINNSVLTAAREAMERLRWDVYDERIGKGAVRYLVSRVSSSGEAILVIVSAQPSLPKPQEFVNIVRGKVPALKGILLNLNPHRTNVILGTRTRVWWGKDSLLEQVGGLRFQVSPTSFFQVNTDGLAALYNIIESGYKFRNKDKVLDLYCGVGTLSLFAARRVKFVWGVESSSSAVEDAIVNSDLNDMRNVDFRSGTVEKVLPELYRAGRRFDLVILDPPRKGCDPKVIDLVAKMRIPEVIYVSCNPATLARDLELFKRVQYSVREVQPLDMFPQTYHVECVAFLKGDFLLR